MDFLESLHNVEFRDFSARFCRRSIAVFNPVVDEREVREVRDEEPEEGAEKRLEVVLVLLRVLEEVLDRKFGKEFR